MVRRLLLLLTLFMFSSIAQAAEHCNEQNVDYSKLMGELQARMKQAWTPPSDWENLQGEVSMIITKKGQIKNVKIIRSSGKKSYDHAMLKSTNSIPALRSYPSNSKCKEVRANFNFAKPALFTQF